MKKNKVTILKNITCPKCKEEFGVSVQFLDKVSETNFHFTCPYCKYEKSIR